MGLELVPPNGAAVDDLAPIVPVFVAYVLSFAILAICWNNHHHLLQAALSPSRWPTLAPSDLGLSDSALRPTSPCATGLGPPTPGPPALMLTW